MAQKLFLLSLLVACSLIHASIAGKVENFEVKINQTTGGFQLYLSDKLWFNSGTVFIHNNGKWHTPLDGSLKLTGNSTATGELDWGPMDIYNFNWMDMDGHKYTTYSVVFREIPVVIFGQQWDDGGNNTSVGKDDTTLSMWPTLKLEDLSGVELGFTTWAGGQLGKQTTGKLDSKTEEIYNKVDGGFPIAIFDSQMENTLVIAPQNSFMSGHQTTWKPSEAKDGNYWGSGLLGTVESVPAGYSMETIMVAGNNISDTLGKWGGLIRERYGKKESYRLADYSINYLGYYTDNGACYYYYSGQFDNYEQALIDVKDQARDNNIPYKFLQLDSWWYFKGMNDGVKNWTAMPSIFPHGIEYVSNKTHLPIVAHNRFFSPDTDYAKQNGGKYNFIIDEGNIALPDDPQFWQDLLRNARDEWNLITYEQDWLLTSFGKVKELEMDLGLGKTWLGQMADAAMDLGITIQYCMSWPRHALQSVMLPAVTHMRVSEDYHPGNENWNIGDSTMLAHTLGLAAFKDTFRTLDVEKNCKFATPEPYPELITYVAALSGGPVGPGDTSLAFNKTLIMATCREDGLLLKPTRPAMSMDKTFVQRAFGTGGPDGIVSAAYTLISGYVWYQILSVDLKSDYNLLPKEFPSSPSYSPHANFPESVALHYGLDGNIKGDVVHIKNNMDIIPLTKCDRDDFEHWLVAPVFPGTGGALLGELDKIVPVSEQRVLTIIKFGDTYVVKLRGAPGEKINMSTYDLKSSKVVTVQCTMVEDGTGTLGFSDAALPSC